MPACSPHVVYGSAVWGSVTFDVVGPKFRADQGLLISWGGFKQSLLKESKDSLFKVRLWTSDNLIEAILRNYDRLPDEIKAELPLKRIWTLVSEEE